MRRSRLLLALATLACQAEPTGSISLFPEGEGGQSSGPMGGETSTGGSPSPQGGRVESGGMSAGGGAGGTIARGGAGGVSSRGGAGGVSSRGGGPGRCGDTSCTSDAPCMAAGLVCNSYLHLCCPCADDTQCTSPQRCETHEGHCE